MSIQMVQLPKPEIKNKVNNGKVPKRASKGKVEMTKSEIRSQNKKIRNGLTDDQINEYSKRIHERLFALKEFIDCQVLFTYISFGSEVDTHEIISKALEMNKHVYVPRAEDNELNFYKINGFDSLIRSDFGILEPDAAIHNKYISSLSANDKRLMILPGLAFDRKGNRIGYGAGYYDRYLGNFSDKEWLKLALAYDFQITNKLTVDIYDVPADYILTPDKLIICKE
ncbi:MAG: 5-formyltetrahydrofolate cyclo-ligase [Anaerolineaceae bacterium]|nr:MAG: 5-formyltetrahydrofolate cyclo-ligase [Anaerolineaceae bacterium]